MFTARTPGPSRQEVKGRKVRCRKLAQLHYRLKIAQQDVHRNRRQAERFKERWQRAIQKQSESVHLHCKKDAHFLSCIGRSDKSKVPRNCGGKTQANVFAVGLWDYSQEISQEISFSKACSAVTGFLCKNGGKYITQNIWQERSTSRWQYRKDTAMLCQNFWNVMWVE